MIVENLDARDALLEMAPPGFFTIAHFSGFPAVLIDLKRARVRDVRAAITDAWRLASTPAVAKRRGITRSVRRARPLRPA